MTSSKNPDDIQQAEVQIAGLEESGRQRRFYLYALTIWVLLSAILAATFAWVIITGIESYPREAQYWSFGIAFTSFIITGYILKRQRDKLFDIENNLRQWQARRRFQSSGVRGSGIEAARGRHRAETWDYIEEARQRAARNRRFHRLTQGIVTVGSILVATLTAAQAPDSPLSWSTVAVSFTVSASAALSSIFRWREQSFNLQQTANGVEKEYAAFELRIHEYASEDADPEVLFAERVEALKEEQRNRELQLEQSPERQTASSAPATGTTET